MFHASRVLYKPHNLKLKNSELLIPTFPGKSLPKVSRFVEDIIRANESRKEHLTLENIKMSAQFFTFTCQPQDAPSWMRKFKGSEDVIAGRVAPIQKQVKEKITRQDEEQGAYDKPLRHPDMKTVDIPRMTYAWFATRLERTNPDEIITREVTDRELARDLKRVPKGALATKGLSEEALRKRLLRDEAPVYWSRKRDDDETA